MDAGVREDESRALDHEGAAAQPVDELVAVRRLEDLPDGVLAVDLARSRGDGEQVQVMVAEDRLGPVAEAHHESERLEGLRPAVDEVAEKEKLRVGGNLLEQPLKALEASLQVADGEEFA